MSAGVEPRRSRIPDAVLQRMLDLETYNELVELVRSLIEEQEKILSETKKQQAADLLK